MGFKRGELLSQPFIYIFTLIVSAFVIYFGFTTISGFQEEAKLVELSKFVSDMSDVVDTYYNLDIGSGKKINLAVPNQLEEICFVKIGGAVNTNADEFFREVLKDNTKYNMFTLPLDALPSPAPDFTIDNLEITGDENPLCIKTDGRFRATIETKVKNNNVYVELRR